MKQLNIGNIITAIIIAGVLYVLGKQALGVVQEKSKTEAVQSCMEISSYTFENGEGVTTEEPIEKSYTKCLELKGY